MTRRRIIKFRPVNRRVHRHRRINNILVERRAEVKNEIINYNIRENFNSSQESNTPIDTQKSLDAMLRSWVNYHRITTRAVNDLLQILKKSGMTTVEKNKNLCAISY